MQDSAAPSACAFTPMPVDTILDAAVRRFAARPALDFLGQRTSYAGLGALVARAAAGLQKLGVTKGVAVGLCLPNTPYSVIMYFAVLKAGGTVVNFNPLYTVGEIEEMVRDAGVAIMVSLDAAVIHAKIGRLAAQGLFKRVIICRLGAALPPGKRLALSLFGRKGLAHVPEHAPYVEFARLISGPAQPGPVAIDPEHDIALLQFTGGTTGTPKAAMLTHANIVTNLRQVHQVMPPVVEGEERFLAILPFFHVFAMTAVMNFGLSIGAELLLLPRLDLKQLMRAIRRRRPSVLPAVPTLLTALNNAAGARAKWLRCFKFCVSGGAALPAEVRQRFERLSGAVILEGYGLSETAPVVALTRLKDLKPGSVGQALPGTVIEIRDPADPARLLPTGAHGEICVRGPQVMHGYANQPVETAQAFVEGAFRTGDIGYLDADGCLFIVDRIKDVIICGGFKVYPRIIEEAACQHPAVQDAAAIGIADSYRGQSPKLFVTLRAGERATEAELMAFLEERLNRIEMPRALEIRASLPRTPVGKLAKKELLAQEEAAGRGLGAAGA